MGFFSFRSKVWGKAGGQNEKNELRNVGRTLTGIPGLSEVWTTCFTWREKKKKPQEEPGTSSTRFSWVKQGDLERQLSDSVAIHSPVNITVGTYGRDNRWCLLPGILFLLHSYITFPTNELMNTVVELTDLSSLNEINMFLQRTLLPVRWWTFVSCRADGTGGAAAQRRERSLLPPPDASSEGQGGKAGAAPQPFSLMHGDALGEGLSRRRRLHGSNRKDSSFSPAAPTPSHSILSGRPLQSCPWYNRCEWLTRSQI